MNRESKKARHVVLDMDGTIYKGSTLFPWTLEALARLRRAGIGYTFLTNNTSHGREDYVHRLRAMDIEANGADIYTAADGAVDYLRTHLPGVQRILLLGTPSLAAQLEEEGFILDSDAPDAVVVGFDTTLNYERLCRADCPTSPRIQISFARRTRPPCLSIAAQFAPL